MTGFIQSFNRTAAQQLIIILIAVTALGLTVWSTIAGMPVPGVVQTLLGVVLGFLGNSVASEQGARQALSVPPGAVVVAAPASPAAPVFDSTVETSS